VAEVGKSLLVPNALECEFAMLIPGATYRLDGFLSERALAKPLDVKVGAGQAVERAWLGYAASWRTSRLDAAGGLPCSNRSSSKGGRCQ